MSHQTQIRGRTIHVDRAQRLSRGMVSAAPRSGLASLQNKLAQAVVDLDTADELLEAILEIVMKIPRVVGAGFVNLDTDGIARAQPANFGGVVFGRGDYQSHLSQVSRRTIESMCVTVEASPDVRNLATVCSPIAVENPIRQIVSIAVADAPDNLESELLIPQLIASYIALWQLSHTTGKLDQELNATSAVLELVGRISECKGRKNAAYAVTNELREFTRCDQVAIGFTNSSGTCNVSAVSGLANFDKQSAIVRTVRSVFNETVQRDEQIAWPSETDQHRHGLLSHKQLSETLRAESVVSCPLRNANSETIGVLSFIGSDSTLKHPTVRNTIAAIAEPVGISLQLVNKAEGGIVRRVCRKLWNGFATRPGRIAAVGTIVTIAAMFVPVTYRIRADCKAEPVARRMCVAPHEGLLEATHAEPGDIIKSGALLANMDGREIRWELAGLEAEGHRASKKRDTAFVKQDVPEAQMATLEFEAVKLRQKLLEFRESNLEIRSPIDGIVLSGSMDRRENYPVTVGQPLYEIAPLNKLRIEIAIPDDEVVNFQNDNEVNITFDGVSGNGFDAAIERIHPRSDVRDGDNVFIAEVTINNQGDLIRPGMSGVARVYGKSRSLGWTLFHKPWEQIVSWVRW